MLSLASTSLLVPTVSRLLKQTSDVNITRQSRGAAVLLIFVYGAFVFFQLVTHGEVFNAPHEKSEKRQGFKIDRRDASKGIAIIGAAFAASTQGERVQVPTSEPEDEDVDDIAFPSLSLPIASLTLIISTTLLAFNIDAAVNSIDQLSQQAHIPKSFIGLVLLPALNNVDPGPMMFAVKDEIDVTIGITVGKCLQTALLITPLMVIVGWCMDTPMTLYFDGFEVASLFASVILLNYLIIDGTSTW